MFSPVNAASYRHKMSSSSSSFDESDTSRLIVFDWDDTLLASTYVSSRGLRPRYSTDCPEIPPDVSAELQTLEEAVIRLLNVAVTYGEVVIITAAEKGWVELSSKLFLPNVLPLLYDHGISIISARTSYEKYYPDEPHAWKLAAFTDTVSFLMSLDHLLSFGDGASERRACNVLGQDSSNNVTFAKSLKFKTRPTIPELRQQVEMVISQFQIIARHEGHLDLSFQKDATIIQTLDDDKKFTITAANLLESMVAVTA